MDSIKAKLKVICLFVLSTLLFSFVGSTTYNPADYCSSGFECTAVGTPKTPNSKNYDPYLNMLKNRDIGLSENININVGYFLNTMPQSLPTRVIRSYWTQQERDQAEKFESKCFS